MDLSGYSFTHKLSDLLLPTEEFYVTVNPAYFNTGGVYVLRSFDDMGQTLTIPRVLDDDHEGFCTLARLNFLSPYWRSCTLF